MKNGYEGYRIIILREYRYVGEVDSVRRSKGANISVNKNRNGARYSFRMRS